MYLKTLNLFVPAELASSCFSASCFSLVPHSFVFLAFQFPASFLTWVSFLTILLESAIQQQKVSLPSSSQRGTDCWLTRPHIYFVTSVFPILRLFPADSGTQMFAEWVNQVWCLERIKKTGQNLGVLEAQSSFFRVQIPSVGWGSIGAGLTPSY